MGGRVFAFFTLIALGWASTQDSERNSLLLSKLLGNVGDKPLSGKEAKQAVYVGGLPEGKDDVGLWQRPLEDYRKQVGHSLLKAQLSAVQEGSTCADLYNDGVFAGKALIKGALVALDTFMMSLSYFADADKCQNELDSTVAYTCFRRIFLDASDLFANGFRTASDLIGEVKKLIKEIPEDFKKCTNNKPKPTLLR